MSVYIDIDVDPPAPPPFVPTCTRPRHCEADIMEFSRRLSRRVFAKATGRQPRSSEDYVAEAKITCTIYDDVCDFLEGKRRA